MHPPLWHPPIELSAVELGIVSRIRRAKLFIFLRQIRHRLFDEQFQRELAKIYTDSSKEHPPVPPAQLAIVVILQAYTGASATWLNRCIALPRQVRTFLKFSLACYQVITGID